MTPALASSNVQGVQRLWHCDVHALGRDSVDSRTCPAIILILSPLGTQTWIEEQDSEERGRSNVSGLFNRSIWSQKYKTKSTWCGPLPKSGKTLATPILSIQQAYFVILFPYQ